MFEEKQIEYNGKKYKIKGLHDGISYNFCSADYLYKGNWYEVKNTQILNDLRRFIDDKRY